MRALSITFIVTFSSETFSSAEYHDTHIDVGCEQDLISWAAPHPIHRCPDDADDDNTGKRGRDDIVAFDDIVAVNNV